MARRLGHYNAKAGTFLKLNNQFRVTTWDLSGGKTNPRLPTCGAAGLAKEALIRPASDSASDSHVLAIIERKVPKEIGINMALGSPVKTDLVRAPQRSRVRAGQGASTLGHHMY